MTDKPTFSDFLEDDRVHIFDGAIGTLIYGRGVFVNVCYDALVLEQPELIRQIHADYAAAGAELIETNTFGANPMKLSGYGLEEKTREINREAAILARSAPQGLFRPNPTPVFPGRWETGRSTWPAPSTWPSTPGD